MRKVIATMAFWSGGVVSDTKQSELEHIYSRIASPSTDRDRSYGLTFSKERHLEVSMYWRNSMTDSRKGQYKRTVKLAEFKCCTGWIHLFRAFLFENPRLCHLSLSLLCRKSWRAARMNPTFKGTILPQWQHAGLMECGVPWHISLSGENSALCLTDSFATYTLFLAYPLSDAELNYEVK